MTLEQQRRDLLPEFRKSMTRIELTRPPVEFPDEYLNRLLQFYEKGFSKRQILISFTKWMHSFNITDVDSDLACMVGEVSEVLQARAIQKDLDVVEELADVVIYCYGIAQMLGMDLDIAIDDKMAYNVQRNYQKEEGASDEHSCIEN